MVKHMIILFKKCKSKITFAEYSCDTCNRWFHYLCENLPHQEYLFLNKTTLSYICHHYLYGNVATYNFDNALQRLSTVSQDVFDDAVRLERIFLSSSCLTSTLGVPCLTVATWTQLTPDQRSKRLLKFANFKQKTSSSLTSTGGHLTIPEVGRVAKKPGQRKRSKNCKTVTAPNKKPSFHWSEEVTQQIREDFKEWITLSTGNRLPRKKDLEKYVERNNIGCSSLQLRTNIMNEQYKHRKVMEKKIKKLKG